jgi:hypothetical protein
MGTSMTTPRLLVPALLSALALAGAAEDAARAWRREDLSVPGSTALLRHLPANPRLSVALEDGALRLTDAGSENGDLLVFDRDWSADPELGASCRAAVRVVRCTGLAGAMIGFSDGLHEDLLTLYPDRLELYRAKLSAPLDTTTAFHEIQVDIRGADVRVSVDGKQRIDGAGTFTFPAHEGRNRFSFGSGASASQGESLWQWVAWTDGGAALRAKWPEISGAEHVVVFRQRGVYAPFPSLSWDPATGWLYTSFSKKTVATHHETLDSTRGLMESRDGGRTWQDVERVPESAVGPRPGDTFRAADGALLRIGQNWRRWFPPEQRAAYEGKYSIETPGTYKPGWFAINSGGFLARSEDNGKTWQRAEVAELDTYVSCSSPWSTLHLRDGRVLRAFMVCASKEDSGDVFVTVTQDGRSATMVRVMGDPAEKLRFTEETLAYETAAGVIWLLTRVEGGDDQLWQAVSRDGGRTWSAAPSGIVGHPPSGLVRLADGRLVLTYGYRHAPFGVRAVISADDGLTWDTDHVIVLRSDGAGYDLGYPVSTVLPDGTVFTIYYFTDRAEGITHIAGTRWQPPAAVTRP